ncbi:DUF3110 domain-containing protein [Synechococcus sp. PCC 6717]|jgi:hypothetical protein|uniref:DUF3110 domain-containing protein n=1 Tax=Parathermosynechococcus lividus PCC 6715 TaxID=1917166 RepID=A0A2D2Q089_PARLV|nr:DUF3110 domain-containing protein [Thermostichus lividus]ATS17926.1 hypothetical protein BRW62_03260 [Thermostichus lividus PCC 6715]MCH9056536.1 DUF3110 domain-containing protein [Synechococcus sp. PCC 6716]MCI3280202.1 DUF3110 domain-containing protein [Synechococcus sp. PCC 6717]
MQVYVLLYNPGTANEGIHSLQLGDRNLILMFECADDAERYGLLLEAQDFQRPSVVGIDAKEVEEFCQASGYECHLVPRGFVPTNDAERLFLTPPERNVAETDWEVENRVPPAAESEFSEKELNRLRQQLEKLL